MERKFILVLEGSYVCSDQERCHVGHVYKNHASPLWDHFRAFVRFDYGGVLTK